jgi:hypothetical protein
MFVVATALPFNRFCQHSRQPRDFWLAEAAAG